MAKSLTKKQIFENLKWKNVRAEFPNDYHIVELRTQQYWEQSVGNEGLSCLIIAIYYHICQFNIDENNNTIFASIGNPLEAYNRTIDIGFDNDTNYDKSKYNSHGNEIIVINPEKEENANNIYEWRYIVESDGNIVED